MKKLINYEFNLRHGNVLKFPASYPYENYLEVLVTEIFHDNGRFGLVIISGHKSGLMLINLPAECEANNEISIDKNWLLNNWQKWVNENNLEDIMVK